MKTNEIDTLFHKLVDTYEDQIFTPHYTVQLYRCANLSSPENSDFSDCRQKRSSSLTSILYCYDKSMYIFVVVSVLVLLVVGYRKYKPLGGVSDANRWHASKNYKNSVFVNQIPTSMAMSLKDIYSIIRERLRGGTFRQPKNPVKGKTADLKIFMETTEPQIMWLGHSTVLIKINGITILTDPMFSDRASPFTFIGPKRTVSELSLQIDQLPPIDIALISHDHYDHLDYASIRMLASKVKKFFVPLGVAAHLRRWGITDENIEELDWWESAKYEEMQIMCTPSRHFSGRRLNDRFKTLWCSWAIDSPIAKLYFSGDSGYGPHFKEIGQKHGPFDLTLMECGQYDSRWPNVHMTPEDTVRAHQDLRGKKLLPIHWGAFVLALHDWRDSARRVVKEAKKVNAVVLTPEIGEVIAIKRAVSKADKWWDKLN